MKLENIHGLDAAHARRLQELGIADVAGLLERGRTRRGRQQIAAQAGVDAASILRWVSAADLSRVQGIEPGLAALLERAGVDTVRELRNRNADNLALRLGELSRANGHAGRAPSLETVRDWIQQAKTLPPGMEI